MLLPVLILVTVGAAFALAHFAPSLGIDLAPLMLFISLFLVILGAGFVLTDVRNGNPGPGMLLGSAFAALGTMRFFQLTASRRS